MWFQRCPMMLCFLFNSSSIFQDGIGSIKLVKTLNIQKIICAVLHHPTTLNNEWIMSKLFYSLHVFPFIWLFHLCVLLNTWHMTIGVMYIDTEHVVLDVSVVSWTSTRRDQQGGGCIHQPATGGKNDVIFRSMTGLTTVLIHLVICLLYTPNSQFVPAIINLKVCVVDCVCLFALYLAGVCGAVGPVQRIHG